VMNSERLQLMDIQIALDKGNKQRARELAERGTQVRPNDPVVWIRLGQAWLLEEQEASAEQAFRKAVEVAPQDMQTWNVLFSYLLRKNREQDLAALLAEMKASKAEIPAVSKALFLGRAYEVLGQRVEAKPYYEEALQAGGKDVAVQIDAAAFASRGGHDDEAKKILRAALAEFPQDDRVRVRLAEVLVRGTTGDRAEANKLLEDATVGENATPANRRMLAVFMARRGGEYRKKAIELFEALAQSPEERVPADDFTLAQLYELERRFDDASRKLIQLAGADKADPAYTVALIEYQLRHGMGDSATKWVKSLREAEPDSFRTLSVTARWLKAQKRSGKIEEQVEYFAKIRRKKTQNPAQEEQLAQAIGQIYTQVGLHAQALRWFQELYDNNPKQYLPVATSLAAQGKIREAVQLCIEKAEDDETPQAAIILASVLGTSKPSPEDVALAKPVFDKALAEFPDHQSLLFSLALVHANLQQHKEAVRLYQQIVLAAPQNVAALNNLAYVMMEIPGRAAEALDYIDRAIDISGPRAELLDTKAMILLKDSPKRAVELLEEATSVPTSDPRYLFHLAAAYRLAGAAAKARISMASAEEGGLAEQPLTATETRLLDELRKTLAKN